MRLVILERLLPVKMISLLIVALQNQRMHLEQRVILKKVTLSYKVVVLLEGHVILVKKPLCEL